MNTKGRIIDGGEITQEGYFGHNSERFFIFLLPKSAQYDNAVCVKVYIKTNKEVEMPMGVFLWNPVALRGINVTKELLSKYRVFWGAEGC